MKRGYVSLGRYEFILDKTNYYKNKKRLTAKERKIRDNQ
jgi:hypothetical protein